MNRCRTLLATVFSMSFAVALLIALALLSAAGSLIGVNQSPLYYVERFGDFWARLFMVSGLTRIYRSPLFLTVAGLLGLSVLFCLTRRFVALARRCRQLEKIDRQAFFQAIDRKQITFLCIHVALLLVGIGVTLDADLFGSPAISDDKGRLWSSSASFRGRLALAESEKIDLVRWTEGQTIVYRQLPFALRLDRFEVIRDRHGSSDRHTSRLAFLDASGRVLKKADLSVNRPVSFEGVTVYQSGVDYAGTELISHLRKMNAPETGPLALDIVVGRPSPLPAVVGGGRIEVVEYRPMNLSAPMLQRSPEGRLGQLVPQKTDDLGPSVVLSIQNAKGLPVMLHQFLQPIELDGKSWWLAGVVGDNGTPPRYWRIPDLKTLSLDQFFDLRQRVVSPTQRSLLVDKVVATAMSGRAMSSQDKRLFKEAAVQIASLFAEGGIEAVMGRLDEIVDETDKEETRRSLVLLLRSLIVAAMPSDSISNEAEIDDILIALSAGRHYRSDWFVVPVFWRERHVSIIEASAMPGRGWVYAGFLLFLLGLMLNLTVKK